MAQRSVSSGLPAGSRRGAKARGKLAAAYREVFKLGREEAEIVLADLAAFSGFYRVTYPGAGDLAFNEGMRAVYGHIFRFLRMTDQEIRELEEAARYEAVISSQEGDI